MPKATVNGNEIEFEHGMTVLQVCESAGSEIPRFCYHDKLKIAGNCRMCLVEIKGGPPKPAASCAVQAMDGMVIDTESEMVKKSREGALEFLLINHPLDCPVCDQGGECDLQDQAVGYGRCSSSYKEDKRSVKDKNMGPFISTNMTRCIQCTRCVRFLEDIAGTGDLGAVNRGGNMEITTFLEENIQSELSGNIIDLCPVGALTAKPYAFQFRSWELKKTGSLDVLDAVGSSIRIDTRAGQVMRILPSLNEDVNEDWIDDKSRFSYDGLKFNRLDRPYLKSKDTYHEAGWEEVTKAISKKFISSDPAKVAAISGNLADCESMFLLKKLMNSYGSNNTDCRQDGATFDYTNRSSYLFNTGIAEVDNSDFCLLIGTNPRWDASIINLRLRKAYLNNGMKSFYIGAERDDFTFPVDFLSDNPNILKEIESGDHEICSLLKKAKNPLIIVGKEALIRKDSEALLASVYSIIEKYKIVNKNRNGFNILHNAASRVGGLDIGFVPGEKGMNTESIIEASAKNELDILYLLGADEIDLSSVGKNVFIIYQGHHGDYSAGFADVILPSCAYTEKDGTYVNTEGRVQHAYKAADSIGYAKEDWKIINEISNMVFKSKNEKNYSDLAELRKDMISAYPHLGVINEITNNKWIKASYSGSLSKELFKYKDSDFYSSNSISRSSVNMTNFISEVLNGDNKEVA